MKLKYIFSRFLSIVLAFRCILEKYRIAKYIENPNSIGYFIHITNYYNEIIKSKKLYPSSSKNIVVNISNRQIPAIYGFPYIPTQIQLFRDSSLKAIKIKLDDDTKKILKIRKHDDALLISDSDLPDGFLDLSKFEYEIIDIPY
ncbi:hypothetical protein FDB25_07540 [Clostridium botulinum]|nr:hypothetical protein [Clostridium botulinum]